LGLVRHTTRTSGHLATVIVPVTWRTPPPQFG
jgi:hypothetical protein